MKRYILLLTVSLLTQQGAFAKPVDFVNLREQYLKPSLEWPKATLDPGVEYQELGLIPEPSFPKNNPFTVAKMRLGEQLFFDPSLSRSGQIACASCHDRDLGWADGRTISFGHKRLTGKRNAPSIENAAMWQTLFWDGRATSLEQQALMPIQDPVEMNFTLPELVARLNLSIDYKAQFKAVFGTEIITADLIGQALATYQRTIVSRRTDFDYFLNAATEEDKVLRARFSEKLSDQALWGLHLFRTKARCINCHHGPLMSDNQFHNIGLTYYKREYEDLGRYLVTKKPEDVGKFKTPSLRGVMNTKPWMHNGLFASMEGVLNIYNAGGVPVKKDPEDPMSPETSNLLQPLELSQAEIKALEAFLASVSTYPARGPHYKFLKIEYEN